MALLTPTLAGFRRAARLWPLILILWLAALLTALPFALLPGEALLSLAGRPVIQQMADGLDAWMWVDLFGVIQSSGAANPQPGASSPASLPPDLQQALIGYGLALALLLPLGGLVSAFCYGGLLLCLRPAEFDTAAQPPAAAAPSAAAEPPATAEPPAAAQTLVPQPLLRRFLWGGWRWLGTFIVLALLQYAIITFALLPLAIFTISLAGQLGEWLLLVVVVLLAAVLITGLAIFEQARAQCVLTGSRNPFGGLGGALQALVRRPPAWLALYGLSLLALLALHAILRVGVLPAAAAFWPAALLAQQVFIAARLFIRAARLAGGMMVLANQPVEEPEINRVVPSA